LKGGWGYRTQSWKGTTQAKFGFIWFCGFRGEDLNLKVYKVQMPNDGKSDWHLVRWAKKGFYLVNIIFYVFLFMLFVFVSKLVQYIVHWQWYYI